MRRLLRRQEPLSPDKAIRRLAIYFLAALMLILATFSIGGLVIADALHDNTVQDCRASNRRWIELGDAVQPLTDLVDNPTSREIVDDILEAAEPIDC